MFRKSTAEIYTNRQSCTPEPVPGRYHVDVQTDALYEELSDAFPVVETCTQTDPFMDRPPTPLFVPQKLGLDVDTQICPGKNAF